MMMTIEILAEQKGNCEAENCDLDTRSEEQNNKEIVMMMMMMMRNYDNWDIGRYEISF